MRRRRKVIYLTAALGWSYVLGWLLAGGTVNRYLLEGHWVGPSERDYLRALGKREDKGDG